jgi:hypothetical protein
MSREFKGSVEMPTAGEHSQNHFVFKRYGSQGAVNCVAISGEGYNEPAECLYFVRLRDAGAHPTAG